jgi:hypothetical protein
MIGFQISPAYGTARRHVNFAPLFKESLTVLGVTCRIHIVGKPEPTRLPSLASSATDDNFSRIHLP